MIGLLLLATMSRRRAHALRPPPTETPGRRTLQGNNATTTATATATTATTAGGGGGGGGGGASIDIESCIAALDASDADSDGYLTQDEYFDFVQNSANGTLDANVYGMPITQFSNLPREYLSTWNFLACGSPSFGCTTGINIGDEMVQVQGVGGGGETVMSAQEGTFWSELCKQYIEEPTATAAPTSRTPTRTPTRSPANDSAAVVPSPCPTAHGNATAFEAGETYEAGDLVVAYDDDDDGGGLFSYYECEPYPESLWCGLAMYEPGNGLYWEGAWTLLERCFGNNGTNATTTSPPTSPSPENATSTAAPSSSAGTDAPSTASVPSAAPVVAGWTEDDPPYSGTLVTTFQYEIFNTELLYAESIMAGTNPMNNMKSVLVQSTNDFVEDVVATTFYPVGGGRRILIGKGRRLAVILGSNSVSIDLVEDMECSDDTTLSAQCQKITASTELTLTDEPKLATELKFQNSVSRALNDPGLTFPADSGIVYVGPALQSPVIVIPEAVVPAYPPSPSPPEGVANATPSWVKPVSIAVAAVGAVALLFLVGSQMQKQKRNQGGAGGEPRQEEVEGDISGSDGTNEVLVHGQVEISPMESPNHIGDLESGKQTGKKSANPFLKKSSDSANPFLSDSDSDSDSSSDGSGSSSSSGSGFSSNEILVSDPESLKFQKEQDAFQQQQSQQSEQPEPWRLAPVQEEYQNNLSSSNWTLMSENSADKMANILVIRAAVEALVMEGTRLDYEVDVNILS